MHEIQAGKTCRAFFYPASVTTGSGVAAEDIQMGMIRIEVAGSFGTRNETRTFSAIKNGHADAVAQAIEFLAGELLPFATALDHKLHNENCQPNDGFKRKLEDESASVTT